VRQDRAKRNELLNRLRTKVNEIKKEGKSGTVSLNVPKKIKRPRIIKERSVLEVLKAPQSQKEKSLEKIKEGVVKWFSKTKGYGFVSCEDSGEDYFLHHSNIEGDIFEGDKVKFKAEKTQKGFQAINVIKQNV